MSLFFRKNGTYGNVMAEGNAQMKFGRATFDARGCHNKMQAGEGARRDQSWYY